MRILIVDDERDFCELLKFRLVKSGHKVLVCHDSQSAINVLLENQIDCMLLDTHIKGSEEGFSFLERIRHFDKTSDEQLKKRIRSTFVLAMSAGDVSYQKKYAELGVRGFLSKPFDSRDLLATLEKIQLVDNSTKTP